MTASVRPKNLKAIFEYCDGYYRRLEQLNGKALYQHSKGFLEALPDEWTRVKLRQILSIVSNLIADQYIHGKSTKILLNKENQTSWDYISFFALDSMISRLMLPEPFASEEVWTVKEASSFPIAGLEAVCNEEMMDLLNGNVRKTMSTNKKGFAGAVVKWDSIIDKIPQGSNGYSGIHRRLFPRIPRGKSKEAEQKLRSQRVTHNQALSMACILSFKLIHDIFTDSKLFKFPKVAALDFTNMTFYRMKMPVPTPTTKKTRWYEVSFKGSAEEREHYVPQTLPGPLEWKRLYRRHHTFFDNKDLFSPFESLPGLSKEQTIETALAAGLCSTVLRFFDLPFAVSSIVEIADEWITIFSQEYENEKSEQDIA